MRFFAVVTLKSETVGGWVFQGGVLLLGFGQSLFSFLVKACVGLWGERRYFVFIQDV